MSTVRTRIATLLRELGRELPASWPGDQPLELDSLTVVMLHGRLEEEFAVRIRAREVVPERFGSLDALVTLVASKLGSEVPR